MRHNPAIDVLLASHHLLADLRHQFEVPCREELYQVVCDSIVFEICFEIGEDLRVTNILKCVYLQVWREWVRRGDRSRESCQDHVLKLDRVLRQAVDEAKVEVAKELGVVL